ncbi:hypothetical protein CIL05_03235 [Virgibacillus profundi]|uniref:Uncharacterized protein n=1 Tax=Virgibacillus profundi TaxID=2024555 RepID=A0A2A2IHY5_9BACI|nr:hypothetical protein [Virgibacillus profundi]PAV30750.1 hypothetical protein CIL05_03235 [Virgibacillus profundi]PXY54933.1 hypothetical protein CIT14_03310 [Virgibacillus profundi]
MGNFIKISSIFTTEGNTTDITFNNAEIVREAIANSTVLNNINTYPWSPNVYQSIEPQIVVFAEIEALLRKKLGDGNYLNSHDQLLEWE